VINVPATQTLLAAYYSQQAKWIGLATGSPGTTSAPVDEASGGSPAYARVATTWTAGTTAGVVLGTPVTIHAGPGTYTYALLCSASTGASMVDWQGIAPTKVLNQATLVCSPTYTQQ
jgi:hypothetical protein